MLGRRRSPLRRGPGVLGTLAVGGVAYAAGSGAAKSAANDQAQAQQIAQLQAGQDALMAQQVPQPAVPPPAPTGGISDAQLDQLERLARLKSQGILTDDELAAQKARILGLA
jgi:Short C-terminal domain